MQTPKNLVVHHRHKQLNVFYEKTQHSIQNHCRHHFNYEKHWQSNYEMRLSTLKIRIFSSGKIFSKKRGIKFYIKFLIYLFFIRLFFSFFLRLVFGASSLFFSSFIKMSGSDETKKKWKLISFFCCKFWILLAHFFDFLLWNFIY